MINVDAYNEKPDDKPILDSVVKANIESIREVLKNFHSAVKGSVKNNLGI